MATVKINLSGHVNEDLAALGFEFHGALHVDLADPMLSVKVAEFLSPLMTSGDSVTLALPGLAPLSAIVLSITHGLTGQFPKMQPLLRTPEGTFVPGAVVDLQDVRNVIARKQHRDQGTAVIL